MNPTTVLTPVSPIPQLFNIIPISHYKEETKWRVSSSGIWRRVVRWVATDVSEEHIASIVRVEEVILARTSKQAGDNQNNLPAGKPEYRKQKVSGNWSSVPIGSFVWSRQHQRTNRRQVQSPTRDEVVTRHETGSPKLSEACSALNIVGLNPALYKCLFGFWALCCAVWVEALRRTDLPSKESYKINSLALVR
jgi:hypothetical protein